MEITNLVAHMFEILKEKNEWDSVLKNLEHYDFYHTYDYHHITKNSGEEPALLKYTEGDRTIALPLLIRKIEGTPFKDATSVYGYPGPITKNINEHFDNAQFREKLQVLFIENNIISVFSRLNPFVPYQDIPLKGLGEIAFRGRIVNIDLTKDLATQRQNYCRRLKSYINNSRRNCTVIKASKKEDVLTFIDMYYENMLRVGATPNYFFNKEYFFDLLGSTDFKTEILLALHNETQEIIAGAMFVKKNDIVQYHLSGSKEKYLDLNPIKLLIDEMRIIATQENYTYFNLGGGVSSNEDSLFHFKSNFSKNFMEFKLWKYIVNERVYEDLVAQKLITVCANSHKQCLDYFPSYRCSV